MARKLGWNPWDEGYDRQMQPLTKVVLGPMRPSSTSIYQRGAYDASECDVFSAESGELIATLWRWKVNKNSSVNPKSFHTFWYAQKIGLRTNFEFASKSRGLALYENRMML